MTTGGGFGGDGGDLLYTDVVARLDQKSFRQIESEVEQAGQSAGKKGGGALSGAFGGVLAGLPGLAATAAAAVGAALIGGVKASLDIASQARDGLREMQAQLGVTAEEAAVLGAQAKQVFANNFGDSLADANAMVIEVRKQMRGLADEDLGAATSAAAALADTFGGEVGEQAQAADTLMKNFGLTSQQAFDFLAKGYQNGLDRSGDFLDTIGEYSTQFKNGGASAEEFFSILQTGQQGGVLGTDKAADAFKEFVVRIQDGSKTTAQGLKDLGINADKLGKDLASGQVTAADAFGLVLGRLRETKDSTTQMQAGVALLGTQFEDLGKSGVLAINTAAVKMGDLNGATAQVSERYNTLGQFFQGAWRQVLLQLEPVGNLLLDLANDAMPAVKAAVAQVGPVVTAVVKFLVDGFRQGKQVAGQFASEFGPQIQRAVATFQPVVQAIGPLFASVFGLIRTLWETVLRPVFTAIAPLITGVVASVGNTLTLLVRIVTGVANAVSALLRGDVGGAVNALRGIFEDGVTFVVRQVRNMGSTILGLIKNLAPGMADAAANVIRGLISGIEGGAAKAVEAARKLAGNVITGVKDALLIKSPSRVMAEMGGYVSEGLANGIDKSSPKAQKAAAKLAKDTTAAAKKELEKSIAFDAWQDGLERLTVAQLKAAQATARAAGEADRYNAIKAELERRENAATAATKRATDEAKAHADQLAANRKAITDGLKFDAYVAGLSKYSDAQLVAAKANALAAGDGQRFNAVMAEQRARLEAAKVAADATAQALSDLNDAQIAAANSAAQRDPQGFTDAAYRQSFGAGDLGLVRSLAAVTGKSVADIRADVFAALEDAKRFAPEAAGIIERVYADALTHRREAAAEDARLTAQAIELANDARAQIVQNYQDEQAAADDARITTGYLAGQLDELAAQGLNAKSNGFIDYLTDLSKGTGKAAAAAQALLDNFDAFWTRARFRAGTVDVSETVSDLRRALPDVGPSSRSRPTAPPPNTTDLKPIAELEKEAMAWRTKIEAQIEATRRQDEYRVTLKGLTIEQLKAAQSLALQNGQAERYAVLTAEITRLQTEQAASEKAAADAHAEWVDNLNKIGFTAWVDGLRDMSDAQLQLALDTARLNENTAEFNALLAEQTRRLKERSDAAAKSADLELNGSNISDRFQKGRTDATEKAAGTIMNTVEAIGSLTNPATFLAFVLEKLNIVGTIFEGLLSVIAAPLAALQEPLRLIGELFGALIAPNLKLLAAVLTPVVNVLVAVYDALAALLKTVTFGLVDVTRDSYKASSKAVAGASGSVPSVGSAHTSVSSTPTVTLRLEVTNNFHITEGLNSPGTRQQLIGISRDTTLAVLQEVGLVKLPATLPAR
ncbi:phage tail tape measure protein [Deinococcus radiotolerans]|uniref:Phage tail protein n=1 Tax=Deinococcus radiotolerans TaxID=1309407 RepID=A0ABQ2FFZ5_9DEIO|nr:phage tail tape measure protein [Deinococcus radiotolerans]GGK91348.1 phage tail protein [Deinococcus radiotolerans]